MGAVILPAAGLATRLGGIPKFLLPTRRGESLLMRHVMSCEGVDSILVITRPDLQDFVKRHLSDTAAVVRSAWTSTMSETVHFGLNQVGSAEAIAVGLPDTVVTPRTPYAHLLDGLSATPLTVAAYPTRPDQVGRLGSIQTDGRRCVGVRDKEITPEWRLHWGAIGFRRAAFAEYSSPEHPHVGYALQQAVEAGVPADILHTGETYFDLGTSNELSLYFSEVAELDLGNNDNGASCK